MDDPWGRDTPPALTGEPPPLPPRLAELAALTEPRELAPGERFAFPRAVELPEVQSLAAEGWRPLEPADAFICLPAVWPAEHRCWVPDRLPRVSSAFCMGGAHRIVPWDAGDRTWIAEERTARVAECGFPPEPTGRIWLLRSPWPSLGLEVVLSIIASRADKLLGNPGYVEITAVARELLTWSEEQVWDSWQGPTAEAARQWRRQGRVGDTVADVVLRGLTPDDVEALTGPAGLGLNEAQAVAWSTAVEGLGEHAVRRIQGWRDLGLPPDPPSEMEQLVGVDPGKAAAWLGAGFALDDFVILRGLSLERAISWRGAGFDAADTRRLLRADWMLTPEEVRAFIDVGIAEDHGIAWIEAGFTADEARAWIDVDVLPEEARVWRSVGQGPEDARPHRENGGGPLPPDVRVGWFGYGQERADRRYSVTDPPGTRGRAAREQAEHAARAARRRGHLRRPPD